MPYRQQSVLFDDIGENARCSLNISFLLLHVAAEVY